MKKDKTAIIIIAIAIILIIILLVVKNSNKEEEPQQPLPQQQENVTNNVEEEYVNVQDDGTKVNTSDKLAETKTIDGLEISNIRLQEKDNVSVLLADVKNPTSEAKGDFGVTLTILDDAGNELASVSGYIGEIPAGGSQQFQTSTTADFANAYDFTVEKQ